MDRENFESVFVHKLCCVQWDMHSLQENSVWLGLRMPFVTILWEYLVLSQRKSVTILTGQRCASGENSLQQQFIRLFATLLAAMHRIHALPKHIIMCEQIKAEAVQIRLIGSQPINARAQLKKNQPRNDCLEPSWVQAFWVNFESMFLVLIVT